MFLFTHKIFLMKTIIIKIIKGYQYVWSPDTGLFRRRSVLVCRFYPTCSQYTIEAIEKHDIVKGLYKGFRRVLRCTPWQKGHIDNV